MTQYRLKMASSIMVEGGSQEGSQEEVEIVDVDETYSENDCLSDQNECSDCVEIKDEEEEDEQNIPRVINLVEELNTTSTSVGSSVIEISPSKLRRSARTSARRYRRSNKTSTSSESEPEVIFIKKTLKRKGNRPTKRKSIDENDNHEKETEDDTKDEKIDEKENKNYDCDTEASNKSKRDNNSDRDIKLYNGHDGHRSSSPKIDNKKSETELILESIKQVKDFFDDSMCRKIEKKIDQIAEKAKCGLYRQKTFDRAPLRNKYFFGEGYTYGKQMEIKGPGKERLHAKGDVDEIPKWIEKHIIQKIYDIKVVKEGFINSAVINEYFTGGCIVSHIDPKHIFDRPIISISFNSKSFLSFGVKFSFNPIRTTEPVYKLPLERGTLTSIAGYAADSVTHCIRPQDICDRRCVIILRRVFPDAPRVGDPMSPDRPLSLVRRNHPRSQSYETASIRPNRRRSRRERDYQDYRSGGEHSSKKRKTRHSY